MALDTVFKPTGGRALLALQTAPRGVKIEEFMPPGSVFLGDRSLGLVRVTAH